jgi:hypothetical protein
MDTWPLSGARGVDPQQARVGVLAPQEGYVQHALELYVVDEERPAGE